MDFQQQDSQEFLRFLLDGMSEDLCRKHSEQETLTSPPGSHNLHGKADAKSLSSPTILPMLPYSTNNSPTTVNANSSSGVMDFSRTAPAGSAEFGQQQKLQQQQQEHSGRSTGGAASQRLRDETQRMRLSSESSNSETAIKATGSRSVGDVALSASSSTTLFPKLKNNNQGEEETSTGRLGSNSKYVSRLRQRSEQGFGDQSDRLSPLPTSTPSSSSSAVMPFSPGGVAAAVVHSSSEKARVDAVLRSADMGEDCSFEDPEGEARSKSENFGEPQQVKQAEIYDSPSGRRLRRVSRPRREENNGNVTGDGSMEADLSASFSQRLALSGVDPQLWTRILNAEKEARVAWGKYLKLNDSVITDIFAGQLQSTIECSTCHHRYAYYRFANEIFSSVDFARCINQQFNVSVLQSVPFFPLHYILFNFLYFLPTYNFFYMFVSRSSSYDPFLDLSVPIYRESDGQQPLRSFLGSIRSSIGGGGGVGGGAGRASSAGGDANKSTLEKCLEKFTGSE